MKNKKILITGGTGHIGDFLVERLLDTNYDLYGLSREETFHNNVKWIKCDLTNEEELKKNRKIFENIDILIHLASFIPNDGKVDFKTIFDVNFSGTLRLVSLLKNLKKIIYVSTVEVFGLNNGIMLNEDSLPLPVSAYGMSKYLTELFLKKFSRKNKIKLITLRFSSVYGYGEKISRAISNFIKYAIKNEDITIQGSPDELRNYLFISDAVDSILTSLKKNISNIFLISSNEDITIYKLAKLIVNLSGSSSKIIIKNRHILPKNFTFDTRKSIKKLGFKTSVNLMNGLKKEIIWFRPKKTIIFDLDGTLLDVSKRIYSVHRKICNNLNIVPLNKKKYLEMKRNGLLEREIIRTITKNNKLIKLYLENYSKKIKSEDDLENDSLQPNVIKTLNTLKGNSLILLTNRNNREKLIRQLEDMGLIDFFEEIISLENKETGLKTLKFKNNILIVGDTEENVRLSDSLNAISVAVDYGLRNRKYLRTCSPNFIIQNIYELVCRNIVN